MSASWPCVPRRKRTSIAMAMATVEAIMITPMIRMIGFGVMKKKTTEPPMPSIGRSCISAPSC